MEYKLCPVCQTNWIDEQQEKCAVCSGMSQSLVSHNSSGGGGGKHPGVYFHEEFTFTKERAFYRGKFGFQAYNSKGENVGLVFECDVKKTPAYEHCELCIYEKYHNRYGEWHRIQSHGGRIKWSRLCELLKQKSEYRIFID